MESIRRRLLNFVKGERNDWKDAVIAYGILLLLAIGVLVMLVTSR